ALKLRVEEGASRAQQAQLQGQELAFGRLVWLHDVFGVKTPTLRIGRVEGILCTREARPMLDHGIELQLVARPRLMRNQSPRDRVEGEIVVLVLRVSIRGWNV